jgi:hypothetical protein
MTSSRASVWAYRSPNSASISCQNSLCRTPDGPQERDGRRAGVLASGLSVVAGTNAG